MRPEKPLPPDVEVLRATPAQAPVVANLLELYAHDLSELVDLQLKPDGRFGYPELPLYWSKEGRVPFLVKVDNYLAGCVLVSRGSRINGDAGVWDMAEFFIARGCRKQGIGTAVAAFARTLGGSGDGPQRARLCVLDDRDRHIHRRPRQTGRGGDRQEAVAGVLLRLSTCGWRDALTDWVTPSCRIPGIPDGERVRPASAPTSRLPERDSNPEIPLLHQHR
jgi:hypothetical protein